MPEYDEEIDETEQDDQEDQGVRGVRKAQRAAEARAKAAEEQLAQASGAMRELGAMKAGLNPDDKAAKFFLAHYDGDLSPEAMKAAAIEAGVLPEVEAAAQASVAGQAQMSAAFSGGEQSPLGTTQVGPRHARVTVPAEEGEMWTEFESAVKSGDFQAGGEILRNYGRQMTGIEDVEYEPGAGAPKTDPISGRPM
jgi:hypothetical protein